MYTLFDKVGEFTEYLMHMVECVGCEQLQSTLMTLTLSCKAPNFVASVVGSNYCEKSETGCMCQLNMCCQY